MTGNANLIEAFAVLRLRRRFFVSKPVGAA
jgi:hypothetical protein